VRKLLCDFFSSLESTHKIRLGERQLIFLLLMHPHLQEDQTIEVNLKSPLAGMSSHLLLESRFQLPYVSPQVTVTQILWLCRRQNPSLPSQKHLHRSGCVLNQFHRNWKSSRQRLPNFQQLSLGLISILNVTCIN
jgi:hypothetical protein